MNTLSLCMIVRDEADMLPDCLRSVAHVADEIIVVDTGSTDRTPTLAAQAGAIVLHHTWTDDFAEARNVAVARATGTFVLVLDADERLAPGAAKTVQQFVRKDCADAGLLPIHNASALGAPASDVLSGAARKGDVVYLPRLFRRTPDLRWQGRIHESPRDWAKQPGRTAEVCEAPIVHLGYADAVWQSRDKEARNLRLLHAKLQDTPGDLDATAYLAETYAGMGNKAAATATWQAAWSGLLTASPTERERPIALMIASEHGLQLLRQARAAEAIHLVDTMESWGWFHANLFFLRGRALELQAAEAPADAAVALWTESIGTYTAALSSIGMADVAKPFPGVRGAATASRLAEVHLCLGELHAAQAHATAALAHDAAHQPSLLLRAELALRTGDAGDALATCEPLLTPGQPDAWAIAAAAAYTLGAHTDAQALAQHAKGPWIAPRRAALLTALSAPAAAV